METRTILRTGQGRLKPSAGTSGSAPQKKARKWSSLSHALKTFSSSTCGPVSDESVKTVATQMATPIQQMRRKMRSEAGIVAGAMFADSEQMQSPKRVLGIEGGGTKTDWVVISHDTGIEKIAASGKLPGSNLQLVSDEALAGMFSVLPHDVTHVGVFLAACATAEDRARLRGLVAASWPDAEIALGSDRDSGLATAFGDADGIAVIAGTGAAVHGRKGGQIAKAGGWGHVLGDRGGGYDLARQGLRLVLTHFDLDPTMTPLAGRILRELSLNTLTDLATWAMKADKMSVARLAPAIFSAARTGEREMLKTISEGAEILARYTEAVAKRLELAAPAVKLIGGLFKHHREYADLYKYRLSTLLPGAMVSICEQPGSMGAAWLASGVRARPEMETARETPRLASASTEQSNPRSAQLDELSTAAFVDLFVSEEESVRGALTACRGGLAAAVDLVGAALLAGGRLFYVGAGTSGRLGVLDASEIPPTFGVSGDIVQGIIAGGLTALHRAVENAEDQPEAGALAVLSRGVKAGDVVCGIAASGRTPFVLGALERARGCGAKTVFLTCNPARERATAWDVEIDLPTGPEIITGSTRLKAGTATKVALNILSTGAMIRLGRVRGNAMVDLQISNEKLRDRGARLVSETLGISYDEAHAKLARANWNVRAALSSA